MKHRRRFPLVVFSCLLIAALMSFAMLRGCHGGQRLVEVFDNGPVRGPSGPSEGYRWVGADEHPPAGKGWKPVDPATLTPEQRTRIR